ncbi:hypothetical protein JXA84_03640, partial [candidate division WOR-3 bacterium]|nr:hypothetical protein [candidate division WOR-3 bacterium]
MNNSYLYEKPIGGLIGLTDFTNRWQVTIDSFNDKKFRQTVINFLNYLNPEVIKKYGNKTGDQFSIPHGSIVLNLKISEDSLYIDAPFLSIPESKVNPLLRQVSEINFSILFLTQIVLEESKLFFRIKIPLELCEPYKLYNIFYEICINADFYDDIFIEKFQAQRIYEPKCTKYSEKDLQKFFDMFKEHVTEALDYLAYFENKRWF